MNLGEMIQEVTDNLKLADIAAPQADRLTRLINRAKDRVVSALELSGSEDLIGRQTYTIASGDASFDLPAGFMQAIRLTSKNGGIEVDVPIVDVRRAPMYPTDNPIMNDPNLSSYCGMAVYFEGQKGYFAGSAGGPSCTLLLRYRGKVADLAPTARTTSFSTIPDTWHNLIVDIATSSAIPAANEEYTKYSSRINDGLNQIQLATGMRDRAKPMNIFDRCGW